MRSLIVKNNKESPTRKVSFGPMDFFIGKKQLFDFILNFFTSMLLIINACRKKETQRNLIEVFYFLLPYSLKGRTR